MSSGVADVVVVVLIGLALAMLVTIVAGHAERRRRDDDLRAVVPAILQAQARLDRGLARLQGEVEPLMRRAGQAAADSADAGAAMSELLGGAVSGADDAVDECLATVAKVLAGLPDRASGDDSAACRAVLGRTLTLSAGPGAAGESVTELVWKLELLGDDLARLGADDGPQWRPLYDAITQLCHSLYGRQLEFFLPDRGEPVHDEFHQVDGPAGTTIASVVRWGVNDTGEGRNLLRARVETL